MSTAPFNAFNSAPWISKFQKLYLAGLKLLFLKKVSIVIDVSVYEFVTTTSGWCMICVPNSKILEDWSY